MKLVLVVFFVWFFFSYKSSATGNYSSNMCEYYSSEYCKIGGIWVGSNGTVMSIIYIKL